MSYISNSLFIFHFDLKSVSKFPSQTFTSLFSSSGAGMSRPEPPGPAPPAFECSGEIGPHQSQRSPDCQVIQPHRPPHPSISPAPSTGRNVPSAHCNTLRHTLVSTFCVTGTVSSMQLYSAGHLCSTGPQGHLSP